MIKRISSIIFLVLLIPTCTIYADENNSKNLVVLSGGFLGIKLDYARNGFNAALSFFGISNPSFGAGGRIAIDHWTLGNYQPVSVNVAEISPQIRLMIPVGSVSDIHFQIGPHAAFALVGLQNKSFFWGGTGGAGFMLFNIETTAFFNISYEGHNPILWYTINLGYAFGNKCKS
jgi:hypothetical protein